MTKTLEVRTSSFTVAMPEVSYTSLDEHEHISTRSLALARYKRNHDYMNEVFNHAAFSESL